MEDKEPAIIVSNLTKSFRIPLDRNPNLKQKILHGFKGKGYREFTPLKDISFSVNQGEFFGIVGRNGSGKSTLLKSIAGIYQPDQGSVKINGSLVPFIELGVGFNPELSGRENVYLNGALLGFSRKEIDGMYEDVVDFAELHDFMEEKLRNYSSGMQVRLAFSIAIRAKGDILLLDEVLAVGDTAFQQKCLNYFSKLKREKHTVILVTHSMASVERYCDRALLLEKGEILDIGDSSHVAKKYEDLFVKDANSKKQKEAPAKQKATPVVEEQKLEVVSIQAHISQGGEDVSGVRAFDNFSIHVDIKAKRKVVGANVGVNIRNDQGIVVFSTDSRKNIGEFSIESDEEKRVVFDIQNMYTNGLYSVDVNIVDEQATEDRVLLRAIAVSEFSIIGVIDHTHSLIHPQVTVKLEER